jgi:tRNA (guanine-N7-)-methyltransferase
MGRKKRRRFLEVEGFPNCFDRDDVGPGGDWAHEFFGNENSLALELGCGKGEYSLALALESPQRNVVGIDKRSDRFWKAARLALERGVSNVVFLRADITDLDLYFDAGQIEAIWIPFPDPRPKRRQAKHRILSQPFLEMYRRILVPGGTIHVKTDDAETFDDLLSTVRQAGGHLDEVIEDLQGQTDGNGLLAVRTTFESRHLERGRRVKYVSFRLS